MDHQPSKPRKSMHAQIVQDLGMHIVSGRFKPEERLPMEATLCEEYKVSRSVLREATRVLSAKGLVYSKPRVGAVVRPRLKWHLLDPDVLSWLMQSTPHSEFFNTLAGVRRILEPEIAAMAATTATDEDIATIEKAYQGMETAQTHEQLLQADLDFHRAIADAARNPFLIQTLEYLGQFLRGVTQVTRANEARRVDFAKQVQSEHQAILEAVQAGDAQRARQAAATHMGNAIVRIRRADPSFWQQEGERLAQPLVKGLRTPR